MSHAPLITVISIQNHCKSELFTYSVSFILVFVSISVPRKYAKTGKTRGHYKGRYSGMLFIIVENARKNNVAESVNVCKQITAYSTLRIMQIFRWNRVGRCCCWAGLAPTPNADVSTDFRKTTPTHSLITICCCSRDLLPDEDEEKKTILSAGGGCCGFVRMRMYTTHTHTHDGM